MALIFLVVYVSSLGISETRAGFTVSVYGLGGLIAAPVAGHLCDRLGPLIVMKMALFLQGLILLMIPLSGSFKSLLCLTLLWAFAGESFRPASSAFIGTLPDEKQRRVSFALNRIVVNIGLSVGPALGGILMQIKPSYVFIANSAASFGAGIFLIGSLRGKSFEYMKVERRDRAEQHNGIPGELGFRNLCLFLLALIPVFIVFYQYRSTMPQYLLDRRILEPYVYGLLLPINALLVIALQAPLTLYLQRWPRQFTIPLGALFIGIGFGCFAFVTTFLGAAICVIVWTLGEMVLLSGSEIYVSEIGRGKKGQYMGLYHMAINLSAFIGPGLGSALLGQSAEILWASTFVCGLLSALGLLCVTKQANVGKKPSDFLGHVSPQ